MLVIRFDRIGKHKDPIYRIVAVDSRSKKNSSYVSLVGTYNANLSPKLKVNKEILDKHLSNGAQMSETVKNLFLKEKVIESKPISKPKKTKKVKENKKKK